MEIAKLYELAAEKLEKAIEVCGKAKLDLSNLTVIAAVSGNVYYGINWKSLNDSFEEEPTHSEDEALSKMLLAGETAIEHIVTLDATSKLPVDPSQKALELMIKLNYDNTKANVLQGKNSKVVLTSVNSEIAKFAEQLAPPPAPEPTPAAAEYANTAENAADAPANQPGIAPGEPEGSAAHAGIDASGLQMIFDDWESTADKAEGESKPFNGNSLSDKAEVINQVQNMAGGGFPQQQQNGMYGGHPMNGGMYQQQGMNGMYAQQQGMNGMYGQQQGMNGMYGQQQGMNGMYGQQNMNNNMYGGQGMNGMYGGQPMNGMYGQQSMMYGGQPMNGGMYSGQPMNGGMYGGQQSVYGQQMNTGRQSLYLNNNHQPNGGNNGQQSVYAMPATTSSAYRSKLQAPVSTSSVVNTQSVSVYGTNIGEGDNNAIFKDRLADILNSSGSASKGEDNDKTEVMMSAKEKKNAAKKDAKSHH